jgi:hypothetical protein
MDNPGIGTIPYFMVIFKQSEGTIDLLPQGISLKAGIKSTDSVQCFSSERHVSSNDADGKLTSKNREILCQFSCGRVENGRVFIFFFKQRIIHITSYRCYRLLIVTVAVITQKIFIRNHIIIQKEYYRFVPAFIPAFLALADLEVMRGGILPWGCHILYLAAVLKYDINLIIRKTLLK